MRLAALVDSPDHVCARYRLRAFEPLLREAGHILELHTLPKSWWGRFGLARSLADADVVILQRKLLSQPELSLLRRRVRRLWFDFDDAIWMRDSYSGKGFDSRKRERRFRNIVRSAELVIAGNDFLARRASSAGARATQVVPTCVDVARYTMADQSRVRAQLVWVGSASTLQGLESISDVLSSIGEALPEVSLKIISDKFIRPNRLRIVETPWREGTEATEIAGADIGISWIPDDPWSRGKCGLKVLQYMAAGLPVVTNSVGVHVEMVRHGETGYLANTPAEWMDAVRTLAADPELRRRMGVAGRKFVERFSVQAGARIWLNALDGLQVGRATA